MDPDDPLKYTLPVADAHFERQNRMVDGAKQALHGTHSSLLAQPMLVPGETIVARLAIIGVVGGPSDVVSVVGKLRFHIGEGQLVLSRLAPPDGNGPTRHRLHYLVQASSTSILQKALTRPEGKEARAARGHLEP